MFFEDLKNPPKKYRPVPFWSWNEKLNIEETKEQINQMNEAGLGGFFMHARGGLQTEYLSNEWFDNIEASVLEAEKNGMGAWGYDENGWPSGFGNGAVNGLGVKYQQKYLRCEKTDSAKNTDTTIANITADGQLYHLFYEVNPFYVDVLDKSVIAEFIGSTYEAYTNRFGYGVGGMKGFFTDEPQISRNGCPWSFVMEKEYISRYNEALLPLLPALFYDISGYRQVRYRFWKMVRDLFAESYNGQIHSWCKKNGQLYTGHIAVEEGFHGHIMSNGACMPLYEYMDIPGMDHLGRSLASLQTEMQLSSVANQLGKKQVLSETFALCGWNVSFEDLRWIYESQLVHGINWLCQHLEGYSLRGIRKRDYPASLFRHQPWWKDYRNFNDMVSRIGMLIAEGTIDYKILVLHNISSGWLEYFDTEEAIAAAGGAFFDEANLIPADVYYKKLMDTMKELEWAQLQYHLGDDRIIERYGSVEKGEFKVGTQSYSVVVVPPSSCLASATFNLLKEFKNQGGVVIFTDELPEYVDGIKSDELCRFIADCIVVTKGNIASNIPDSLRKINLEYDKTGDDEPVAVAVRSFKEQGMTMYYLVNPNETKHDIAVTVKGKSAAVFDSLTGEETPVCYKQSGDELNIKSTLQEKGSLVLFVYDDNRIASDESAVKKLAPITDMLSGDWELEAEDNALTLDVCDLYFDGELAAENLPISDAQEKACAFGKKVKTELVYHFEVREDGFNKCRLVVETPEIFDITVNGQKISKNDLGYYHDPAFRIIDIKSSVKLGINEVRLGCQFEQSAEVYENIQNSLIFESEKNKLSYDMELEAVYIIGDFAVKTDAAFEKLERRALRTEGGFYICNSPKTVKAGNMAEQGYPFFAGSMTFKKTINLTAEQCQNRSFEISRLCSTVTKLKVNGSDAGNIMWRPYVIDLSDLLHEGENTLEVTVTGNLRNLLGPFHLAEGECLAVGPSSFFHESPLWLNGKNPDWVDSYCFVEFGLFF